MALTPGTRLGPYEVTAQIGVGGMGEVYKATDTNLKRAVAIKVLPASVARDAERLARFQREAEVLAALNHPNIAQIHGLEKSDGTIALVMELVEGPTLADRIAQGTIPIAEALPIAKQIAEALEAAHDQGIIHRDLKPSNIKVRPDGVLKVLDFGLAKAMEPTATTSPNVSQAPTITEPAMTQAGAILGTAAYMSPEQATGNQVDKRADTWAFGAVLYEILTGYRAFDGGDVPQTLALVLTKQVDWGTLPAETPAPLARVLRRCLKRDPVQRLRDIREARIAVDEALTVPSVDHTVTLTARAPGWQRALTAGAMLTVATAAAALVIWSATRPALSRVTRTTIAWSPATALSLDGTDRDLAITPDGTRVIYSGNSGTQLFMRSLDQIEATTLVSASGTVHGIFAAPNGEWIGFVEGTNTLRKVASTGGPPITILTMDGNSLGAAWTSEDSIVFATANGTTGLQRVAANGGAAVSLTQPNRDRGEADHVWPEVLPNGKGVLFTIIPVNGNLDVAQVAVLDFATGMSTTLVRGGHHAHYVASGHLVYAAGNTLRAVAFDLDTLEVSGTSGLVVPRVVTTESGAADFSVALDGTLVYVDAPVGATSRTLVWVDRQGLETPIGAPPRAYQNPRLLPDGAGITLAISGRGGQWVWDLGGGGLERRTEIPSSAVWTPDGKRMVFGQQAAGGGLFVQNADGTGTATRITESLNVQIPTSVTPDGRGVVFHEITQSRGRDVRLLPLGEPRPGQSGQSTALIETPFDERNGVVSSDGRWLAYESDSYGQFEVLVKAFPNVNEGHWQVSAAGGRHPLWAKDNRELVYMALDGTLVAVPVESRGSGWRTGTPRRLSDRRYYSGGGVQRHYDISPDGQRFVVLKQGTNDPTTIPVHIVLVQNWFDELKRLVPPN